FALPTTARPDPNGFHRGGFRAVRREGGLTTRTGSPYNSLRSHSSLISSWHPPKRSHLRRLAPAGESVRWGSRCQSWCSSSPPFRPPNRSNSIAPARVLHRYCACESGTRWPQPAVPAGEGDLGVVVASSSSAQGGPLARMASAIWSAALPTAGFLIRPPSRLL